MHRSWLPWYAGGDFSLSPWRGIKPGGNEESHQNLILWIALKFDQKKDMIWTLPETKIFNDELHILS